MQKHNYLKIILVTAVLGFCALSVRAQQSAPEIAAQAMRGVEQKLFEQYYAGQKLGFKTVQAQWELIATKTSSHRKVSVTVDWGKPRRVQTTCRAVKEEGKLYVARSCYYPEQKSNETVKWLSSYFSFAGQKITLQEPTVQDSGLVVFILP